MPAWLKKVHPWAVGTPPQASPFHKPTHGRLKIVSGANTASTDIFTVRGQRVDPRKNISEYATIEFHPKSSIPYPNPVVRAVNMDIPGITTNLAGRVKTYKRHHDFKLHHFPSAMEPRLLTLNNFQRQAESKMFNLYKIVDEGGTCRAIKVFRTHDDQEAQRKIIVRHCKLVTAINTGNLCTARIQMVQINDLPVLAITSEWLQNVLQYVLSSPHVNKLRLVQDIAAIISSLHSANTFHGNIYPGNVMVTRTGQVRVADTGLNALTRQSSVLHTGSDHWPYKSPEELENPREVTAAMDTYSFAVTAYVIFNTRPPFRSLNPWQGVVYILRHGHSHLRIPPGMSGPMWELLRRCLDYMPSNRPGMAEVSNILKSL